MIRAELAADKATGVFGIPRGEIELPTDERTRFYRPHRRNGKGQTLLEVVFAIAILSVIVVLITGDLTNATKIDASADRSIEISAANYLLGVMKSDPNFWSDWGSGPSDTCLTELGPYTDPGPSPSPDWHPMPTPPPGCNPLPFTDQGAPQQGEPGGSPAPVGDTVEYMWSAQFHGTDTNAADLTVWVRRDAGAPVFEYHAIRYTSPEAQTPSGPLPSPSQGHGGGGGGGGGSPKPSAPPTPIGV